MLPGRNIAAINAALHPSELIQKLLIDPFRIAASRRRRGWHAPSRHGTDKSARYRSARYRSADLNACEFRYSRPRSSVSPRPRSSHSPGFALPIRPDLRRKRSSVSPRPRGSHSPGLAFPIRPGPGPGMGPRHRVTLKKSESCRGRSADLNACDFSSNAWGPLSKQVPVRV